MPHMLHENVSLGGYFPPLPSLLQTQPGPHCQGHFGSPAPRPLPLAPRCGSCPSRPSSRSWPPSSTGSIASPPTRPRTTPTAGPPLPGLVRHQLSFSAPRKMFFLCRVPRHRKLCDRVHRRRFLSVRRVRRGIFLHRGKLRRGARRTK